MKYTMTQIKGLEETNRLKADEETFFIQTTNEYDKILSKSTFAFVDELDTKIKQTYRLVGPSGCGKTTLSSSIALDLKIADLLINEFDIPVWKMNKKEMAVLSCFDFESTNSEKSGELSCSNCGATGSTIYERKNKSPTYRCQNCQNEFENNTNSSVEELVEKVFSMSDTEMENVLYENGLYEDTGSNMQKTLEYPHDRGECYRNIYEKFEDISELESIPHYEVSMSHSKYAKDLIGHPHITDDETVFEVGKVTEAISSSKDEPTVLVLDEINRAPTSAKDELYDALDGRVKVTLDEMGGIDIKGSIDNLIIVTTMNQGKGYHVEPIDFAEKRRFGSLHEMDYLGMQYPKKEIELVEQLTPVSKDIAQLMVETANKIRETAQNTDTENNITFGVPTERVIAWATEAYTNSLTGIEEPIMEAGRNSIAKPLYDHDSDEQTIVMTTIENRTRGYNLVPKERQNTTTNSTNTSNTQQKKKFEAKFVCQDMGKVGCSWSAFESEIDDEDVLQFQACPKCNEIVERFEPGEQ